MSFGNRELDRAYDNWKTQSPEDYYGWKECKGCGEYLDDDDDGDYCKECEEKEDEDRTDEKRRADSISDSTKGNDR